MPLVGVILTALAVAGMLALYWRRPHVCAYPLYGYLGLAVIVAAEAALFAGLPFVRMFMTPLAWTGYIAAVDAAVYSLSGDSLARRRRGAFLAVIAVSTPFWLIFEAYNLRLHNWTYINLPASSGVRYFGYAWAFSTIWPGMLETAYLLRAAGLWRRRGARLCFSRPVRRFFIVLGAAMLAIPLLVPRALAAYLFGLVWLGFIFLLDPLNSRLSAASLLDDLEHGRRDRLYSLLLGGAICGILWEFWNYWADTKWVYIFPMFQNLKIFEMPVPGYLGFPPFAVEYFCMYVLVAALAQRIGATRRLNYVSDF
jgi:hypothetical protein